MGHVQRFFLCYIVKGKRPYRGKVGQVGSRSRGSFSSLKKLLQRKDYKWGTFRDSSYVTSLKVRDRKGVKWGRLGHSQGAARPAL